LSWRQVILQNRRMGTRTETTHFDDIDGSTENVRTVPIAVDGQQVEIDLSAANVDKLMAALEPYLSAGRKVGGGSRRRSAATPTSTKSSDTQAIREWAQSQGLEVNARGRIKKEVVDAYNAAN
jgi:hypothetical protein